MNKRKETKRKERIKREDKRTIEDSKEGRKGTKRIKREERT